MPCGRYRIPANCGFTPQTHPSSLSSPPQPTASSPRTHKLINSGLVVLRPSSAVLASMMDVINTDARVASYRFPDQDFLADWYGDRSRLRILPWCYNALKKLRVVHPAIWRDAEVRNVHYILDKPWNLGRPGGQANPHDPDHVTHTWWWEAFDHLRDEKNHNDPHPHGLFHITQDDWALGVEKYVNLK